MLLGMTKDGILYEMASHRDDAQGVSRVARAVNEGDVTLGSAARFAAREREARQAALHRAEALQGLYQRRAAARAAHLAGEAKMRRKVMSEKQAIQDFRSGKQNKLMLEALTQMKNGQGVSEVGLSGYGLSSDGRRNSYGYGFGVDVGQAAEGLLSNILQSASSAAPQLVPQIIGDVTGMEVTVPPQAQPSPVPAVQLAKPITPSGLHLPKLSPLVWISILAAGGLAVYVMTRKK